MESLVVVIQLFVKQRYKLTHNFEVVSVSRDSDSVLRMFSYVLTGLTARNSKKICIKYAIN